MKKLFITSFSLLLLFSFSPAAGTESQSVCINKVTGDIRVSDSCNNDESQGSLTIAPVKLTKIKKIKAQIQQAEEDFQYFKKEAAETLKDFNSIFTDDGYCANSNGEVLTNLDPKGVCSQFRALYEAMTKNLNSLNRQLQNELKSFKTITCKKGSRVLTVTDSKPKCPKGYKLKK